MTDRPRPGVRRFLERSFPAARTEALAGDASTRRFYRVLPADGGPTRIVMDYGRPFEGDTDDMIQSRIFRDAGLPVFEVLDASPGDGCLLLEDLGDRLLEGVVFDPGTGPSAEARSWLERAVCLAAEVAERGTAALRRSERAGGPALDAAKFRFEMDFFLEHFVQGLRGGDPSSPGLRDELHRLADAAAATPRKVLCHRDFHSRNLLVAPGGRLVMVDIQDARWGPDSYDLASLLRDAYVELEDSWIDPLVDLYLERLSDPPDRAGFRQRFRIVSAQRMIKALGTFGFQTVVRGSDRYLEATERTERRLRALLPDLPETSALWERLARAKIL